VEEPTYFIQIAQPEEPDRWHTIARVQGHELADEVVRLAQGSYMRTTVIEHYLARALSRTHLRRDGKLAHAEWEVGMGDLRHYGQALVEKAEKNLASRRT
jgi:hypothetical protein